MPSSTNPSGSPINSMKHSSEGAKFRLAWLAIGIALVAHLPLLIQHFVQLWSSPEYQFFPFVLAAVVILSYVRWNPEIAGDDVALCWRRGAQFGTLSAILLTLAVFFYNPWTAAVSFVVLMGCLFSLLGWRCHFKNMWGVWALLWLIVPPPAGIVGDATRWLQSTSSMISSELLDLIGVDHAMEGNTLVLAGKRLFVDEACSGIVSVMSVVACAAIFAVWYNRSLLHSVLLVALSVFWAMLMNVARISTIAFAESRYGVDLSEGTPHEILGLAIFLTTFLAVVSTDQLLLLFLGPIQVSPVWQRGIFQNPLIPMWNRFAQFLLPGEPQRAQPQRAQPERAQPERAQPERVRELSTPRRWIPYAAIPFLLLIGYQIAGFAFQAMPAASELDNMPQSVLPVQMGHWKLANYIIQHHDHDVGFGNTSHTFRMVLDDDSGPWVTLAVDYPFASGVWHDLTECYRGIGWERENKTLSSAPTTDGKEWDYVTADFTKTNRFGYLAFGFVNSQGQIVHNQNKEKLLERLRERLNRRNPYGFSAEYYQLQAWYESPGPIDEKTREQITNAFLDFREHIRSYVTEAAK